MANLTDPDKPSRCVELNMYAGAYGPYGYNHVGICTNYFAVPEPRLVKYQAFHNVMLALAETFDATQAYA